MGDMLSTGVSGLLAFQTALDTISNNISNVDTAGYSEETANLVTAPSSPTGGGWIGNGVSVGSVTRSYSDALAEQTNSATSSYNQFNTVSTLAAGINNMFGDASTGLSATLQSFSNAVQTMANSPSLTSTRQAVLTQAQTQRTNQTGVSLDAEAAKLLQFQQSYQAVGKLVGVINSLTDTLMAMMPATS